MATTIPPLATTGATDLTAARDALALARQQLAATNATVAAAQAAFEAANAELLARAKAEALAAENADAVVRTLALKEYERLGVKKLVAGVEIAIAKTYAIDETAGLAWAREKQMCLVPESLDVKAVKKLATVQPLPFVIVTETPSVRIASDLSPLSERGG